MEIYKVNNINDFLKEGNKSVYEIVGLKSNIEDYIRNFFCPSIDFKLDSNFDILVQGEYKAIFFDQNAFLKPLASLLDISLDLISPDEIANYIKVRLENKLTDLKGIKREEELIIAFPTLSGIYRTKKESIVKSVALEQRCKSIKPMKQGEEIKIKRLREMGISKSEHDQNLIDVYSFSLQSFIAAYLTDLERIGRYFDFLKTIVNQAMMPVSIIESIDENKINSYINDIKQSQKSRELK